MYDNKQAAGFLREMPFKMYKEYKLNMLIVDFCIKLEPEELAYYDTLDTETKVDQFCVRMFNEKL